MARYQAEVDRLNGLIREIDGALKSTLPNYPGHLVDKAAEAEKKSTRERLLGQVNALNADLKAHTEAYDATRKRLAAEKAHWFCMDVFCSLVFFAYPEPLQWLTAATSQCPRRKLAQTDVSLCNTSCKSV